MSPRRQTVRTRRDAVEWVGRAVDFYKAVGRKIALAEYTNPEGQFVDRDMYIYALDTNGVMLAHGANENFVGKEWREVKDYAGKHFIQEILDTSALKGRGWVEYKWYDPELKELLHKAVYFEKADDVIICSGIYPRPSKRTRRHAMDWVGKGIDFYNAAGKGIALAEFTNPKGQFIEGEMYIFALDANGIMLAHGENHRCVGESFIDVKDADGKPFIKELVNLANTNGNGWVEYTWYDPESKEQLPKAVYFEKVEDVIICSGVYKQ